MKAKKVNVPGLGRLPAFCDAVIAGDFIIDAVAYKPNAMSGGITDTQ